MQTSVKPSCCVNGISISVISKMWKKEPVEIHVTQNKEMFLLRYCVYVFLKIFFNLNQRIMKSSTLSGSNFSHLYSKHRNTK